MAEVRDAEEIFKEFREHSISEFFKKNRQMLGYSGMVRSLVTVVHEYVTNSLDACEDANILPNIEVAVKETGENKYTVKVSDNGPGVPKKFIGKALGTVLAGTKFHRYVQQRGQQGIGGSGCTLFALTTTGKPIYVKSSTGGKGKAYACSVSMDMAKNQPIISDYKETDDDFRGLMLEGEFAEVKYENSDHGIYEYLRRTALSNPHAQIRFVAPDGRESVFVRAVTQLPEKSKPVKPHPLGLSINDLLDYSRSSQSRKITSFLIDTFARVTQNKVDELKAMCKGIDFEKAPKQLTWAEAETLLKAIKQIKWIAPDASSIIPIGEERIKIAIKNILDPEFMNVVQRRPAVLRGGIPFVVEAAVAYGGNSGYRTEDGHSGAILRFANRAPLLFDASSCAITEAVRSIEWKRYNIDIDNQPVSVFVNLSSVYVPYSGVGKEAISKEDEVIQEIKLALQEAARGVQGFIRGKQHVTFEANRYKTTMRYAKQLAKDLGEMTGEDKDTIEKSIEMLILKHYPHFKKSVDETAQEEEGGAAATEEQEDS